MFILCNIKLLGALSGAMRAGRDCDWDTHIHAGRGLVRSVWFLGRLRIPWTLLAATSRQTQGRRACLRIRIDMSISIDAGIEIE